MSAKTSETKNKEELFRLPILAGILLAGLILRIVLRLSSEAYPETIYDWARLLYRDGFAAFYSHPEAQWPYPPLYLYILWLMQCLIEALHISDPALQQLIIQLPPILCDLGGGILLYSLAMKRWNARRGLLACALYVFNPAVIHNSSVWGQTDSVFTLIIALMCLALCEEKLLKAFILFGAALLIKQQSLTFAPLILIAIARGFLKEYKKKDTLIHTSLKEKKPLPFIPRILLQGLAVMAGMLLLSLPFGLVDMLKQYLSVQSGMNFASVDAYNFWTLIDRNWAGTDTTVLHVSCKMWGKLAIVGITLFCFFLAWKRKDKKDYPLLGALLISFVFCFATGMHERYLLSALLLLLTEWVIRPEKATMLLYFFLSLLQFLNTYLVFEYNLHGLSLPKEALSRGLSAGLVLCTLFFLIKSAGLIPAAKSFKRS
ncbi:MAG: glycosyltransferase family 39 protein [Lachnospiraceae bacterium]|nr:glycosyltransferase family 39 protein [Lachnospiraceae bacterium]